MKQLLLCAALLAALHTSPASARDVSISVDGHAGPWLNKANKKMRYGKGDEAPPAVVTGFVNDADAKLEIFAASGATTQIDGHDVGPEGIANNAVDDSRGPGGKYYPSLYTPKVLYPANRHALVGAFVDGKGQLMGRPFVIGNGVRVTIPNGAAALNLGFNDVSFAPNSGALAVTVTMPDD